MLIIVRCTANEAGAVSPVFAEECWWKKSWKGDKHEVGYDLDMVSINIVTLTSLYYLL
jgi:hypothetical protein